MYIHIHKREREREREIERERERAARPSMFHRDPRLRALSIGGLDFGALRRDFPEDCVESGWPLRGLNASSNSCDCLFAGTTQEASMIFQRALCSKVRCMFWSMVIQVSFLLRAKARIDRRPHGEQRDCLSRRLAKPCSIMT